MHPGRRFNIGCVIRIIVFNVVLWGDIKTIWCCIEEVALPVIFARSSWVFAQLNPPRLRFTHLYYPRWNLHGSIYRCWYLRDLRAFVIAQKFTLSHLR